MTMPRQFLPDYSYSIYQYLSFSDLFRMILSDCRLRRQTRRSTAVLPAAQKSAADTDKEKKEGTQPKAVSDVPQNAAPVQQNTSPAPQNMPFVRQPAENPNVGLFSHSSLTPDFAQNLAKETESRPETAPGGEVPSDVSPEKQLSSDVPPAEQP